MVFDKLIGIVGIILKISGTAMITTRKRFSREKTYLMFLLGGVCLLTYSIIIKDIIFIAFQGLYIIIVIYGIIKIDFSKRREGSSFRGAQSVLKTLNLQ